MSEHKSSKRRHCCIEFFCLKCAFCYTVLHATHSMFPLRNSSSLWLATSTLSHYLIKNNQSSR